MNAIRIGTSGWSYKDWVGPFYEPGTAQGDYLAWYGQRFEIVEVDSTFYRPPTAAMVRCWGERTPDTFRFALKAPRRITHERVLTDCDSDMEDLIATVDVLGPKLKSVLLQFSYFNRAAFSGPRPFLARLEAFLERYAARLPLACEIRNRAWLKPDYFDLLRRHGVAAALVEHAWLPPIGQLVAQQDVVTGPYSYVRLIGDRTGIEQITKTWGQVVVDRTADLRRIAQALRQVAARAEVVVFVNNHYAGHAPESCRALRAALDSAS
jgi:uncharacterized protein YecE (DUF72 family)